MARDRSPGLRRQFRLRIDDGWLQVTEWGSREPDVTVVLTHGWSLSSSSWEDVAELLVAADPTVRVLAYDHRGHGGSARAFQAARSSSTKGQATTCPTNAAKPSSHTFSV
jgi:pimeloyl-ACP methyl ester carboxylesterase